MALTMPSLKIILSFCVVMSLTLINLVKEQPLIIHYLKK